MDDEHSSELARQIHRFKPVNDALDKEGLINIAFRLLQRENTPSHALSRDTISIDRPLMSGSYHILHTVMIDGKPRWLVRIPVNGVRGRWDDKSAAALVSEAKTMNYLHSLGAADDPSKLPIPRVLVYSDTTENSLRCPYILITYIHGTPLYKLWFKHRADDDGGMQFRMRALQGIAEAMTVLGKRTFDQGGSLVFEDCPAEDGHTFFDGATQVKFHHIGPGRLPDYEAMLKAEVHAAPAQHSISAPSPSSTVSDAPAHSKITSLVLSVVQGIMSVFGISNTSNNCSEQPGAATGPGAEPAEEGFSDSEPEAALVYYTWGPTPAAAGYVTAPLDMYVPSHPFQKANHELLRTFIKWVPDPFDADPHDRFVLRHPDLDLQNILVDDDGTVVGIIDWDGIAAVPRSVGNECYPMLLTLDWNPDYNYHSTVDDDDTSQYDAPETLAALRRAYLAYIMELQEKGKNSAQGAPFSEYLEKVCRQSIVTETIVLAAHDPYCRSEIIGRLVDESWATLKSSGGGDYRAYSSTRLTKMFMSGSLDGTVMEALKTGFLKLLATVD